MSGFETILYSTQDGHARITLNRPDKLNALSYVMQAELSAALWEADNDRDVHCVILEGAGRASARGMTSPAPMATCRSPRWRTRTPNPIAVIAVLMTTPGSWSASSAGGWHCSTCTSR